VADDRFASPNTYQCFAPWHFLVSEWMMTRFGNFLMPEKRPMDNMKAGWTLPQEDEFALMNMGCASPYTRIAFPKNGPVHQATLDMEGLSDEELSVWKTRLHWFVKALTVRYQKQLVMKSPPHTGRIGVLHEMYPESRFIHITRDPRKIFPSTLRLWQSLDDIQGLQSASPKEAYEEFVFDSLNRMYHGFEKQRALLPPGSIIDLRYEDLIADPVGQLRQLYDVLGIDDFDRILPALRERLDSDRDYQTNKHSMSAEQEQRILSRWHEYAKRYGYLQPPQGMKNAS
jgi:hypothetical protein